VASANLAIAVVGTGLVLVAPGSSEAGAPDDAAVSQDVEKADRLYQAGSYDQAIDLLKEVESRYAARGNVERDETYAAVLVGLANAYQAKGRYAEAEPLYTHSLAIREQALGPSSLDVAAVLNNLAEVYRTEGRLAEAEPLYTRAAAIIEKAAGPEDPTLAQCLNNLALLYVNLGRFAEAETLHKRSLAIRQKALGPDSPDVGASLTNLGELYQRAGRYTEAEPLYRNAALIFVKALGREHPYVAVCVTDLASLYVEQGRFAEAEPLLKRALAIREKALGPDHPVVTVSLDGLAELYRLEGRFADAEPLYKRAVAILEKALGPDYPDIGISLTGFANIYADERRYDEAEALDRRVLAIQEKAFGPQHPSLAPSLNNLAEVYRREHRFADAEPLYRQAAALIGKAFGQDHPSLAAPLTNLALVYADEGRFTEAEPLFDRALAIRQQAFGPDHFAVGESLTNLARLYQSQGRYTVAEPLLKRALAIFEKALGPNHSDVGFGLNSLALLYDLQGRYADALPFARTATERGFVSRQVHLSTLAGAYAAGLIAEPNAVGESFSVVQRAASSAASLALGQLAVRFAAGSSDLAGLVRREQDLASADDQLDKAVVAEISKAPADRSPDREQALRDGLAKTAKALADVRAELGARFPDYVALAKPQVLALADAQALLGEDEAMVVIDLAPAGSDGDHDDYVWALTREAAGFGKLTTKPGEIADEAAALRAELDPNGGKAFDTALAYRLYQQTFGLAEKVIAGKHQLLVVLSGALTGLPPQVLISADPAGKTPRSYDWLIRRYAVTVLPSVSSVKILANARARSAAVRPMTGYGDPVFAEEPGAGGGTPVAVKRDYGSYYRGGLVADVEALRRGLPALPETAGELRSVARSVGADPADIKLGSAATVTAVKAAPLDRYRIIYFATHALVAGEVADVAKVGAEPALALSLPDQPTESDDGLLKASEVAGLRLDADMVVLSACNTAAGDRPGAEALSGLARAFFYAGARALIVSHWPVKSDATVRLMTATFTAMAADPSLTPSEALRRSMLALIDDPNDPDGANPSSWAPFIVVGGARSPG
jgi:CHAT domain-containing protein/Tfp pilus assembly protein PilF